ncbi:Cullin-associated NEDD8-dissociated protein [Arachis hypogaea]|nr:Cullin-associated NEDD8-dissociated protein [Arachis hypogaea]
MLSKLYDEACPKLIDRFKEREENVKMDVFNTFIELLRQTGNVTKGQTDANETSHRWLLKQEVSKIVKSINRQLREKSIKTKVVALSILKELVVVLPDCLADHIGSLIPGIEKALNDKSYTSNLKIEALIFTILVLSSQSPDVFYPYIKALSAPVLSAVGERYYKVTAEALRVCGELILVVRPSIEGSGFDFRPYVHPIYNGIMSRIINQDRDHEVKECAICCIALIVSIFALALELCCTLMSDKRSSPSAGLAVRNKVLPQALTLIKSSLLQEQVLLALQNFFAALVYSANTISANEIDESCDERVPEPLIPSLNEEPYAPLLLERVSLGGVTTCPRQAFTTVRWHCQTSIVFNSSMCGCSVPCCWGSEVFVHSENAGRHFQG